jgi:hypothetical protein
MGVIDTEKQLTRLFSANLRGLSQPYASRRQAAARNLGNTIVIREITPDGSKSALPHSFFAESHKESRNWLGTSLEI